MRMGDILPVCQIDQPNITADAGFTAAGEATTRSGEGSVIFRE